jgi:hypothetical protein
VLWERFERWLCRGGRPRLLGRVLNRGWAILYARGIAPDRLVTLRVVGRRSGRTTSLPVVMAVVGGQRHLVSMLGGDAPWVRNVRAAHGQAVLRHGRTERVHLEEVAVPERGPVLKAYLGVAPGARAHLGLGPDATLAPCEATAPRVPVFRVRPAP